MATSGNTKKMKTIGLIGGMSWESSLEYYRIINEEVKDKLGGLHSAECVMYSVDFAEIEELQRAGEWEKLAEIMGYAAQKVEAGGADFAVICTNTMHKVYDDVAKNIGIPLIHIADATAEKIKEAGLRKVGLLGTSYTMEEDFYKGRLSGKYNLEVLIPGKDDRTFVNGVIFDELCRGIITDSSRQCFIDIIENLVKDGAECVILGCTEIHLLVKQEDCKVPLFDTAGIHAKAAVEYALKF